MGNTLEAYKKTHRLEGEAVGDEGGKEESYLGEDEDLKKYIPNAEDWERIPSDRPARITSSNKNLGTYSSSISLAPVNPTITVPKPQSKFMKCCKCCWKPFGCFCRPIIRLVRSINHYAAYPVYDDENLQNGVIFVSNFGLLCHTMQVLFSLTKKEQTFLAIMYNLKEYEVQFEYVMIVGNALLLVSAYSIIWQTCGPYVFAAPLYMLYLVYSIFERHLGPSANEVKYGGYRSSEQVFRLLFLIWQFCVIIAYVRTNRSDRAALDAFIKAKRHRIDFIGRTRRHEDRRQFLRDPIRQKTVLLLADPQRPWLKQSMAAKLAERAFSENATLAALWVPERQPRFGSDLQIRKNKVSLAPKPKLSKTELQDGHKGGIFSFIPNMFKKKKSETE